jgi:nucleoid-associated protein YgaU
LPGPVVRRQRTDDTVVVRRGDCLWDIAARRLGPDATDAQIAAEWPQWYATNRAVIGDRPDLLEPGQRLRPPVDHVADGPESDGETGGQQ